MAQFNSRRGFVKHAALAAASLVGVDRLLRGGTAPAQITAESERPQTLWGLQLGDVRNDRAVVWSRADRASRLVVEWADNERFEDRRRIDGPYALESTDYTARVDLTGLVPNTDVFVKVYFEALSSARTRSEPQLGRLRTSPRHARDVRFVWSGDTAGQGWGIDSSQGGMRCYEAMRLTHPDFFIHSGDNIYADGPMLPEVKNASGEVIWRNAHLDLVPEKLKVAETLHDFRRNYLYNRYDPHVRAFSAEVPQVWQWGDHEVTNNWSDSKVLDSRYSANTTVQALVARGSQAFFDYAPISGASARAGAQRIYRHIPYGPDLDVFVLDTRSYRAANGCNDQVSPSAETSWLGAVQLEWLKGQLRRSTATWKVLAIDVPLGVIVSDGGRLGRCAHSENAANGDGPVKGREFEVADLLRFMKSASVRNVVWLTADVHYCAAHYYDPAAAHFEEFDPFWEFVAGPLHAGAFAAKELDDTFGPTVVFHHTVAKDAAKLPPSAGFQSFGQVDIEPEGGQMTVSFKDQDGTLLFAQVLEPARG